MAEKRTHQQRLNLLLAAHALLYALAWAAALYQLSRLSPTNAEEIFTNTTRLLAAVLLWLPVLALHVGAHLYARRWLTPNESRSAYREGFADALRQFADEAYNSRPRNEDDDTVVNVPEVKHKRSS